MEFCLCQKKNPRNHQILPLDRIRTPAKVMKVIKSLVFSLRYRPSTSVGSATLPTAGEETSEPLFQSADPTNRTFFNENTPSFIDHLVFDPTALTTSVFLQHNVELSNAHCLFAPPIEFLSSGGTRIVTEENAGGASEWSEAMSFEILRSVLRDSRVSLSQTEMEIEYWWTNWAKTDYSILMRQNRSTVRLGVSVTRAVTFGDVHRFDELAAAYLLVKKLHGVLESTRGVLEKNEFKRQILHVLTPEEWIANILRRVWIRLRIVLPHLCGNTIVIVSVVVSPPTIHADAHREVKLPWIFYPNYKVDAFRRLNEDDGRKIPPAKATKKLVRDKEKRNKRRTKMMANALEWTDGISLLTLCAV